MKKGAAIALGIGAGLAALYAANKVGAFGSSGEGSAGGEDKLGGQDSLTAEGNPFGRIDPNAQYPTPTTTNNFFYTDPNTGDTTVLPPPGATGGTDGSNGPGSGDTTGGQDPGAGGAQAGNWADTWYGQLGIIAAADVAVMGAAAGGKAAYNAWRGSKLTGLGDLKTEAGLERAGVKTADLAADANKVGKAQDVAEMERLAARGTKVGDATMDAAKISRGGEALRDLRAVEPTGNAALDAARMSRVSEVGSDAVKVARTGTAAEAATTVGRLGKVASTAGKVAGAAGGIIDTALVGYNVYSYEQDYKGQKLGVGDHAKIAVAGVAKTGEQTVDPFFSLIYRPKHVAQDLDYKESGWFAGFRENFWSGMFGGKKDSAAATQSSGGSGGSSTQRATVTQPLNVAPSSPSTPVAQAIKRSGGGGSSIVAPKITSSTVLSTGKTVAQTTQSIAQLQAKGYNNAQIVNILSSQKSSGGSSSSSSKSSSSSSSSSKNSVSAAHAPTYKLPSWAAKPAPKPSGGKSKWP